MNTITERKIIKNLANKYNLTMEEVEKIVYSPYHFLADIIKYETDRETQTFPSLRIKNFGIFFSPPWVKEKFKNKEDATVRTEELSSNI